MNTTLQPPVQPTAPVPFLWGCNTVPVREDLTIEEAINRLRQESYLVPDLEDVEWTFYLMQHQVLLDSYKKEFPGFRVKFERYLINHQGLHLSKTCENRAEWLQIREQLGIPKNQKIEKNGSVDDDGKPYTTIILWWYLKDDQGIPVWIYLAYKRSGTPSAKCRVDSYVSKFIVCDLK